MHVSEANYMQISGLKTLFYALFPEKVSVNQKRKKCLNMQELA
jgi:hypothetical protein